MKGLEEIYSGRQLIAIIFRKNIKFSGIKFFTDPKNPFQVGVHSRKKGLKLNPHIHKLDQPIIIKEIQEILFIQKGKIKIELFSPSKKLLVKKILKTGDSILLLRGGHGVEFLEDSKIFELKQGPYPGSHAAKILLKSYDKRS